jgi:hypothetical protein
MIWIFVLAGAFAQSAKAMGSIDATVNLTLALLPPQMILAGMFLAACFVSISIGTSVGTIAALVPIAAGVANGTGTNVAMMTAIIVGGSFFGDNLSFISDTPIMATQTQGCRLSDKFRVNIYIVFPAALLVFGYPTEQQKERKKPERLDIQYIVQENQYRRKDSAELREMFCGKAADGDYESWMRAFCQRKYNSDFAREMTRSVRKYLEDYSS